MINMMDLSGKVAIVTGCNTGLGKGMAIGLARSGCYIAAVNRSEASETKLQVEALGSKFLDISADLATTKDIPSIVEQTIAAFGHIDILINNAGIIRREDAISFSEEDWDDVMNVNMKTLFFLSQAVAKQFIEQGNGGKIVNIASMLSFQGGIRVASYTTSKSGVMGITRLMANEWAKHGINVNSIAPGYMATNNTEALQADEARNAEILGRIPAGRWGKPEDLEGPVVFLCSDAANYIHGYTIAVDGGWLAR